jgi:hydrogenase maturation protease
LNAASKEERSALKPHFFIATMDHEQRTLILGIGNLLMGDEGVGVHAARMLEKEHFPDNVYVVDGGTGGFHLLSYLQEYDPIIMIDATMDGNTAGTLNILKPKFSIDFPRSLTAHDIGLRDLIEAASLTQGLPMMYLITVSIHSLSTLSTELSPEVSASLAKIKNAVENILNNKKLVGK